MGSGDYFMIIASTSHALWLTEHAANGLVEGRCFSVFRLALSLVYSKVNDKYVTTHLPLAGEKQNDSLVSSARM